MRYKFSIAYVAIIPLTNWLFSHVGVMPIWGTQYVFHPLSFLVGLWLVLRDFSHKELGDRMIFVPVLLGMAASFYSADQRIAVASAVAFMVSECVDYAIYRWTNRPLAQRVLLSSAAGVPIDSLLFSGIAFGLASINPVTFGIMLVAKMLGAMIVAGFIWRRP